MSQKRSNINKAIYPVRIIGYLLAILSIIFHQYYIWNSISTTAWVIIGIFLVYPHMALILSNKAKDHREAEFWVLGIDLFWIGWIGYLLDFNLMSALPFLLANSATAYSVGGIKAFVRAWGLWLLANLIILVFFPLPQKIMLMSADNVWAFIPSVIYLFAATHYVAFISFHRGVSILKVKKQLEEQNIELKEQKEELLVMNEEIKQQNEEIVSQRDHIDEQNKILENKNFIIERTNQEITSSINYAKRIQHAILPEIETIKSFFPESFVLYKPRDIVSGDFYWFTSKNYKIIIAAVDCTGHGIPGALMSMIGNEILNDIIKSRNITEPDKILYQLRKGIIHTLRQEESNNQDGMDVAICTVDNFPDSYKEHLGEAKLEYAGAGISLLYMQNDILNQIKGDRIIIGGLKTYDSEQSFQKHSISLTIPTTIYLSSDGYTDQFGGSEKKKFSSKRFKELLQKIHPLSMEKQQHYLKQTIENWMLEGDEKQLDDITVLGIRLS
ncbi:hypothetical protein AD998_03695 [bacterium 336/3]|nr:hypothetical protein AD998_03695 [bacterium 336/3]